MPLCQLHTGLREHGCLLRSLDTFCDHLQRRRAEQRGQTCEPLRALRIVAELRDQRVIDFHEVEMATRQERQVRAGQRRVVERHPVTRGRDAIQCRQAKLVGHTALGNLQDELLRPVSQPRLAGNVFDAAAPQNFGRHVDANEGFGILAQPVSELGRHGVYDPLGDGAGQRRLLGLRDELAGVDDRRAITSPTNQRFRAHTTLAIQRNDGLINKEEFV